MEKEKPTAIFGVGGWCDGNLQPGVMRPQFLHSTVAPPTTGPKGKRRRVSSYFCRLLDALLHVLNRAWISTSRTKSGVLQQFSDLPVPGDFNWSLPVFILGVWVSPVG